MLEQDQGPRFKIDQTAGAVVTASNILIATKKTGGEQQARAMEAMEKLLDILANKPGAIEVFAATQES